MSGDFATRYEILDKLGEGGQAEVFLARKRPEKGLVMINEETCAVKVYANSEAGRISEDLLLEIEMLQKLDHPHIVKLLEVAHSPRHVYLVQELLSGGELFEHLLSRGPCGEAFAKELFAQLVLAIDYLHDLHVAHRDIKAENLVFRKRGESMLHLIDFGTADTWEPESGLSGLVGTPQYMAPEVVIGWYGISPAEPTMEPYSLACDLWSMGVLLFELISFSMPFGAPDTEQVLEKVADTKSYPEALELKPTKIWDDVSDGAKDLVRSLLTFDPSRRITAAAVKEHPWLKEAIAKWEGQMGIRPKSNEAMRKTLPKRQPTLHGIDLNGESSPSSPAVPDVTQATSKRRGLLRRKSGASTPPPTDPFPQMSKEMRITFESGKPLGIGLQTVLTGPKAGTVLLSSVAPSSAAAAVPIDATVKEINGLSLAGKTKDEVLAAIVHAKSDGPVTLTFLVAGTQTTEATATARAAEETSQKKSKVARDKALYQLALRAKRSKGQQYWYAREIGDPENIQKKGGVQRKADGSFEIVGDNVPPEMMEQLKAIRLSLDKKKMLSVFDKKKAPAGSSTSGAGKDGGRSSPLGPLHEEPAMDPVEASMLIVVEKERELQRLHESMQSMGQEIERMRRDAASGKQRQAEELAMAKAEAKKATERAERAEARVRELETGLSTEEQRQRQRSMTEAQLYKVGDMLLVERSDGSKSPCNVLAYDAAQRAYKVSIDGSNVTEIVSESMLFSRFHSWTERAPPNPHRSLSRQPSWSGPFASNMPGVDEEPAWLMEASDAVAATPRGQWVDLSDPMAAPRWTHLLNNAMPFPAMAPAPAGEGAK